MDSLRDSYDEHRFFVERDLVCAVQLDLWERIRARRLGWSVFNDYPMIPGPRRAFSADLAIRDPDERILLAVEFKFEPDHRRSDLLAHKFPVIGWGDAQRDIERIRQFVDEAAAPAAYAILVDEGRFFRTREAHPGSDWIDWATPRGDNGPAVLWSRWPKPG